MPPKVTHYLKNSKYFHKVQGDNGNQPTKDAKHTVYHMKVKGNGKGNEKKMTHVIRHVVVKKKKKAPLNNALKQWSASIEMITGSRRPIRKTHPQYNEVKKLFERTRKYNK